MEILLILDLVLLLVLMLTGVPVAFSFAAAACFLVLTGDYSHPQFLISSGYGKTASPVILAIPLYILAGAVMSSGGISVRLLDLANSVIGHKRGGLGVVVIVSTAIFGAISGMASSAVAAIGSIMVPRMVEKGYNRGYACSLVAASAVLALLIPPSATMIIYGWVSGTPILQVFLAPVIPGFILIGLFCFWNYVMTRKMDLTLEEKVPTKQYVVNVFQQFKISGWGLVMPMIILGFIYGGITTPTEAAAVAVFYALPVGFVIYKELTFKSFYDASWKACQVTAAMMILIFCSTLIAKIYTMEDVPQYILGFLLSITDNKYLILMMVNVFLIMIGLLMEDVSGFLLATPLLMPVMNEIGVHPVHFAAIMGTNLGMGLITPPTAPILFLSTLVGKADFSTVIRPTLVFVFLAYLPVVILTTYLPELSLWLPRLLTGIN